MSNARKRNYFLSIQHWQVYLALAYAFCWEYTALVWFGRHVSGNSPSAHLLAERRTGYSIMGLPFSKILLMLGTYEETSSWQITIIIDYTLVGTIIYLCVSKQLFLTKWAIFCYMHKGCAKSNNLAKNL